MLLAQHARALIIAGTSFLTPRVSLRAHSRTVSEGGNVPEFRCCCCPGARSTRAAHSSYSQTSRPVCCLPNHYRQTERASTRARRPALAGLHFALAMISENFLRCPPMSGCGGKDGVKDDVKDDVKDGVKDDVKDGRRRTAREDAGIRNRAMLSMLSALGSVVVVSTPSCGLEASPCPGALVCAELACVGI